jgi:DUF4097 and DUF4098 domain-containing protein YvlB
MDKRFVVTSENPKVVLDVRGNLTLKGTDEPQVSVKSSDPNAVTLEQEGDTVTIRARSNCDIKVPREAQVQVIEIRGETVMKAFEGELNVKEIHGNLTLRSIGPAMLDLVQGNLEAKNVEGSLEIQHVDGNVTVRDVQGDLYVKTVRGNLQVLDVDGSVEASADGNISMNIDPTSSDHYSLTAKGNIACNVPIDASLALDIPKAGGQITIKIAGVENAKNVKAPYQQIINEGSDARF